MIHKIHHPSRRMGWRFYRWRWTAYTGGYVVEAGWTFTRRGAERAERRALER
jgi:hypothetical protein